MFPIDEVSSVRTILNPTSEDSELKVPGSETELKVPRSAGSDTDTVSYPHELRVPCSPGSVRFLQDQEKSLVSNGSTTLSKSIVEL